MNDERPLSAKEFAFLCLLTLLNVMNFVDRQLLASFANFIVPDLGLTNTQFGLLTGFAFIIFYATMGLFMGALADLVHRPRLIAAGLALWSALTAASGAARGFVTLAMPRTFIGVGESALTPTSMSLLSDRFPAGRLGFASGFYYMGVPIGVGVSLLDRRLPRAGDRLARLLLRAGRDRPRALGGDALRARDAAPPRRRGARAAGAAATGAGATRHARADRHPGAGAALVARARAHASPAASRMHFVLGAATFDQLWYVQERGFDRAEIARMTGWIGMIAGILGNLFGGHRRRLVAAPDRQRPRHVPVLAGSRCSRPFNIAYRMVPGDSPFFWIGVFTRLLRAGRVLRPDLLHRAGAGAAADPRHRGGVLHPDAQPDRARLRHHRRRLG